ncbi:lysylphosphatidylglycerol synthase transmembrane domain-containing protein [Pseudomonas panipatensis]|uniref:lysylphosphatidylglycerol synthase transmembrane domain-containing protein n=1 Tax=Pseudomonas panipatensis TaxID=428992 RepID=UPI0035B4879A
MSRAWWLLIALLGASLVPLILGGRPMLEQLAHFPLDSLLLMLGMILLCWLINAQKLRVLLAGRTGPLSQRQSIGIVMASEFAFYATPGGSGAPLTLMALLARRGMRPAQSSAIFAVDQLSDLLFFLCALLGVLCYALSHSLSPNLKSSLLLSALLLGGILAGVLLLARFQRRVIRGNGRLLARLGVKAQRRLHWARKLLHFRDSIVVSLRQPKRVLLLVFLLTSSHWLLRFSVLYMTLQAMGVDLHWAWTFLIQLLSLAAGLATLLPGGAGGTELTSLALLSPLVGKSTAAAAILVWRVVTYYFYLVAGAPVFFMMAGRPLLRRLIGLRERA